MNVEGEEWQLALGLLSGMNAGGDECQLAVGLLSGINVESDEWQLAVGLLSGINAGGDEWQLGTPVSSSLSQFLGLAIGMCATVIGCAIDKISELARRGLGCADALKTRGSADGKAVQWMKAVQ